MYEWGSVDPGPGDQSAEGARRVGTGALAGGIAGGTTAALFADRSRTGVALSAGAMDLRTCWTDGAGACRAAAQSIDPGSVEAVGDSGAATFRYRLLDEGRTPAFVWLRSRCPAGVCGLERALSVTVRDVGCQDTPGSDGRVLLSGSLCEVLDDLGEGLILDADPTTEEPDPLEPGTERCLRLEWTLREPQCGDESVTLAFEQFAQQAPDGTAPSDPWPDRECDTACRTSRVSTSNS